MLKNFYRIPTRLQKDFLMYSLRIGCFIGALFTSFGIYAQCDEKAKNAGSTGFSNEVVEKIAEKMDF